MHPSLAGEMSSGCSLGKGSKSCGVPTMCQVPCSSWLLLFLQVCKVSGTISNAKVRN